MRRLKDMGLKNFLCVFIGEDRGRTHYTGELWDLVLTTGTMDVIRMAAPVSDMPAAYAAASVVVSGAVQPEGVQRPPLEAQAMARPVIVSDLAAGPDVGLTAPAVPESRATGLRVHSGDDAALAAAVLRLFSLSEPVRAASASRARLGARPFQRRQRRRTDAAALRRNRRARPDPGLSAAGQAKLVDFERFKREFRACYRQSSRNRVDLFAVSTNLLLS